MTWIRDRVLALFRWVAALFAPAPPRPDLPDDGRSIRVGAALVPPEDCPLGTVFAGVMGTGKTSLIIRMLLGALRLGDPVYLVDTGDLQYQRCKRRARPGTKVWRINVHKKGATALDFAAVLTDETSILNFATKVVPVDPADHNKFFSNFARRVLVAAIRCLNHFSPKKWLLADLLWVARNRPLLAALCKASGVENPYDTLDKNKSANDVAGTVHSLLDQLDIYANLSEHAVELVSPLAPIKTSGVMVLEWFDLYHEALRGVYAFALDLVGDHLLSRRSVARCWVFADELASLAKLEFVPKAAKRSRKSAIAWVYSVHEIESLYPVYGQDKTTEILNLPAHKVFLRLGGEATCKWAQSWLGSPEILEGVRQEQKDHWTRSYAVKTIPNVTVDTLRQVPMPDVANDVISGYAALPETRAPFRARFLANTDLPNPDPEPEDAPPEWQSPRKRGVDDLLRLGVPIDNPHVKELFAEELGP